MESKTCKPNGTQRFKRLSSAVKTPAMKLSALCLLSLSLAGCVTTGSTETAAQCSAWRAIYYSASKDTQQTIRQILVHNKTGAKLCGWK